MPSGRAELHIHDEKVKDRLQLQKKEHVDVWIQDKHFASGGCRHAFIMQFKQSDGQYGGQKFVAKAYMRESEDNFVEDYVCSQMAAEVARAFNEGNPYKKVSYVIPNRILILNNKHYTIEEFLEGQWQKHNDIFGNIYTQKRTPDAFTHFSWVHSGNKYMILDVQGVGETYTDPAVVSIEARRFGFTDTGLKGIRDFFVRHQCNEVCRALGLEKVSHIPDGLRWDDRRGGGHGHHRHHPYGGYHQAPPARIPQQPSAPFYNNRTPLVAVDNNTGGHQYIKEIHRTQTDNRLARHKDRDNEGGAKRRSFSHEGNNSSTTQAVSSGWAHEGSGVHHRRGSHHAPTKEDILELTTLSAFDLQKRLTERNVDFTGWQDKMELIRRLVHSLYPGYTLNLNEYNNYLRKESEAQQHVKSPPTPATGSSSSSSSSNSSAASTASTSSYPNFYQAQTPTHYTSPISTASANHNLTSSITAQQHNHPGSSGTYHFQLYDDRQDAPTAGGKASTPTGASSTQGRVFPQYPGTTATTTTASTPTSTASSTANANTSKPPTPQQQQYANIGGGGAYSGVHSNNNNTASSHQPNHNQPATQSLHTAATANANANHNTGNASNNHNHNHNHNHSNANHNHTATNNVTASTLSMSTPAALSPLNTSTSSASSVTERSNQQAPTSPTRSHGGDSVDSQEEAQRSNSDVLGSPDSHRTSTFRLTHPFSRTSREGDTLPTLDEIQNMNIKQLKSTLFLLDVDYEDCFERDDLVRKVTTAVEDRHRNELHYGTTSTSSNNNSNRDFMHAVPIVLPNYEPQGQQTAATGSSNSSAATGVYSNSNVNKEIDSSQLVKNGSMVSNASSNTSSSTHVTSSNAYTLPANILVPPSPIDSPGADLPISPKSFKIMDKLYQTGLPTDGKAMFLKYGKKGNPHRRYLSIKYEWNQEHQHYTICLLWQDVNPQPNRTNNNAAAQAAQQRKNHRILPLENLREVHLSCEGRKFQKHLTPDHKIKGRKDKLYDRSLCFSLVFPNRSIDLLALERDQFEKWTQSFKIIAQYNRN